MVKAVIFDLDGTLLDTSVDLANAVNYSLAKHGAKTHSTEKIVTMVGNGVKNLVTRAFSGFEVDLDIALADFKDYYSKHNTDFTCEYFGVTDMLKRLKANGIKTAIVSNKYDGAVKLLAEKYFSGLIDCAYGEQPPLPKKPAPDLLFMAIKDLGVDAKDCVYVGDSEVDILTAKNANLNCISVSYGFKPKSFLVENHATVICETVPQLSKILLK